MIRIKFKTLKNIENTIVCLFFSYDQQTHWQISTELKPWLLYVLRQVQINIKFDHTSSLIRLQAFGRLRPVVSLLGLISHSDQIWWLNWFDQTFCWFIFWYSSFFVGFFKFFFLFVWNFLLGFCAWHIIMLQTTTCRMLIVIL